MNKLEKIATIVWGAIYITAIPYCILAKENTKKYLADPHIGDLYITKVAYIDGSGYKDTRLAGIMKLIDINGDVLTFSISETAYFRRGSLYLIKKYSDDFIHLHQDDLHTLYDKDIIEKIKRE